jgi:hypothetical protein
MATPEDLSRLNAHLRPLAGVVHAAMAAGGAPWIAAVLDARFTDGDGGFIYKIRVEGPDGPGGPVTLPAAGSLELISLGQARPGGADRWHGLVLRVTAEGVCEVRLNYDPACAENPEFFAS